MKEIYNNPFRSYRQSCQKIGNEVSFQVLIAESDLLITAPSNLFEQSYAYLKKLRLQLENYIIIDPNFLKSLVPISVLPNAPEIIQAMAKAGEEFKVGPFAAVAGTIAEYMARYLASLCENKSSIIVENGGDIYICGNEKRVVSLLFDPVKKLSINILANNCAICVSSATIGHSLSFGKADFLLVKSKLGSRADAAATSLCNKIQTKDDVQKVITLAKKQKIDGIVVYFNGEVSLWGDIELKA